MSTEDDLRKEYPSTLIRSGERGKYARCVRAAVPGAVVINPDLRDRLPDSASVNRALRAYLRRTRLPRG
ncbi:MAG: hypothetical protein JNM50_02955 [Chromatiales bacterium]|nr:hypothetical protein [Chromatiales bacterium]